MADIATPTTARKTEEFTASQRQLVRDSLFIHDFPYQPDKTYIVFDADSGNNDLHIDTGGSSTYSITQGDGTQPVEYTDTGGTKTLNYTNAGRYLITIDGTFNGIDTVGVATAAKEKYIGIVAGSNYPNAIAIGTFVDCSNLEFAYFANATSIGSTAFKNSNLKNVYFPLVTSIGDSAFLNAPFESVSFPLLNSTGQNSFDGCTNLKLFSSDSLSSIGGYCFQNCESLETFNGGLDVSSIGNYAFNNCDRLKDINFITVTSIGNSAFSNCASLIYATIFAFSGITIGTNAFSGVKLADLYAFGASNLTEAQALETKLTTAGMTQLTGYRLLY